MFYTIYNIFFLKKLTYNYNPWRCKLRLKTDLASLVNLRASSIGKRFNRAVSLASQNQDLIGIALSKKRRGKKNYFTNIKTQNSCKEFIVLSRRNIPDSKNHKQN